eukprot:gene2592-30985_t
MMKSLSRQYVRRESAEASRPGVRRFLKGIIARCCHHPPAIANNALGFYPSPKVRGKKTAGSRAGLFPIPRSLVLHFVVVLSAFVRHSCLPGVPMADVGPPVLTKDGSGRSPFFQSFSAVPICRLSNQHLASSSPRAERLALACKPPSAHGSSQSVPACPLLLAESIILSVGVAKAHFSQSLTIQHRLASLAVTTIRAAHWAS